MPPVCEDCEVTGTYPTASHPIGIYFYNAMLSYRIIDIFSEYQLIYIWVTQVSCNRMQENQLCPDTIDLITMEILDLRLQQIMACRKLSMHTRCKKTALEVSRIKLSVIRSS